MTAGCFAIDSMSARYGGGVGGATKTGGTNGFGADGTYTAAAATSCAPDFPRFAAFRARRSAIFASRASIFACAASILACATASFAACIVSCSAIFAALVAFSSASLAFFFASSAARFAAFLSIFVGAMAGTAAVKDVGAAPTLNGLFGALKALGADAKGVASAVASDVVAAGGAACADGANLNGEFGELKIDGTVGWGGGAGGGGAGGLVKGSGYSGIALAAAENGFGVGMYCDCWGVSQSGVVAGAAGSAGDCSASCSCPGGGGTRPSATSRGS